MAYHYFLIFFVILLLPYLKNSYHYHKLLFSYLYPFLSLSQTKMKIIFVLSNYFHPNLKTRDSYINGFFLKLSICKLQINVTIDSVPLCIIPFLCFISNLKSLHFPCPLQTFFITKYVTIKRNCKKPNNFSQLLGFLPFILQHLYLLTCHLF